MNKKIFIGISIGIIIAAIFGLIWILDYSDRKIDNEISTTMERQKADTTKALRILVDVANNLSSIKSGAVFNFELVSLSGRAANFGIVRYDGVQGDRIVEEQIAIFRELNGSSSDGAEVDVETNRVVAMHRTPINFGSTILADELEATARQFAEKVYPDFTQIESMLEFKPGSKTNPKGSNYFFRWNDKRFALPKGVEMDLPPFIQVGITSSGFIFSYDNTVQLYHNLSKSDLKKICAFVEIPQTDDSLIDREKGIVKVSFTEYEPFQNRFLVLPYEPETDFEGCSESAKEFLRHLPNEPK